MGAFCRQIRIYVGSKVWAGSQRKARREREWYCTGWLCVWPAAVWESRFLRPRLGTEEQESPTSLCGTTTEQHGGIPRGALSGGKGDTDSAVVLICRNVVKCHMVCL